MGTYFLVFLLVAGLGGFSFAFSFAGCFGGGLWWQCEVY